MAASVGAKIYAWRVWLVSCLFALTIAGFAIGLGAPGALKPGGFGVTGSPVAEVEEQMRERFGRSTPDLIAVYAVDDAATARSELTAVVERLKADPAVEAVGSPLQDTQTLVASDGAHWLVTVDLAGDDLSQQQVYDRIDAALRSDVLEEQIGGTLASNVAAQRIARDDLIKAELISIPIVLILLIVFFRGIIAAMLPVLVGAFSVAMSLGVLRLLALGFDVSVFALNIVTFLGLGLAIDYALFMVQRFREELGVGNPPEIAVRNTVATAGKTISYSGLAVAASLLGLLFVPIMLLRSIALAGTLVVLLTNFAAVILLPAVLAVLGHRVGGVRPNANAKPVSARFWRRTASTCMRWPVTVAGLVAVLLLFMGMPFLRMQTAPSDARVFAPDTEVRQVFDILSDRERFPELGVDSAMLLVRTRGGADVLTAESLGHLHDYVQRIEGMEGVENTMSIVSPFPSKELAVSTLSDVDALPEFARERLRDGVDGDATLIRVTMAYQAHSSEARELLRKIERSAPPQLRVGVSGITAQATEVRAAMAEKLPYSAICVSAVTFIVLVLAFGAPVIAIKAVLMNALSLTASFGALVWIFQDGRFEGLLDYASVGTIDPTVPVMMFAIVFGLSMDYELFLLSRIKEHHDHVGDNSESVCRGLQVTGPIITSAAILLLAVIIGLITGSLVFLKELGVGMALAIIIDATLIRVLLVPATMALLGKKNWWAPKRALRWWKKTGIGVAEGEAQHFKTATGGPVEPTEA